MKSIHLGFEIGSGEPVSIPLKHTVITGQTQEAGKTTTLEALISRSGLRALTFITKRGESSFRNARQVDPYFREQADWQFVASILEASRGEKLKFERAWIIRASKGARTLADVQRNVRKAMETAKGMSADVYLTLDAYLDAVVPQIAKVKWAPSVSLSPGVNVMDLTSLNVEMQHLVIKSSLDWILNHEDNTVVVIPEAWKFIPQGRGTPVKLAAESYIRQAAGLRNYLWLDSQDIAGVEKIILKSVPLWILGVQRESNEIKRTLAQIPANIKKPTPDQIATLELGQFIYCYGKNTVKVYVQPEWMDDAESRLIAQGKAEISYHETAPAPTSVVKAGGYPASPILAVIEKPAPEESEDDMSTHEIDSALDRIENKLDKILSRAHAPIAPMPQSSNGSAPVGDEEALYQRFKARLLADIPALFKVDAESPELVVTVTRPVIEADGKTLRGRLLLLIADGFFDDTKKGQAAFDELTRLGFRTSKPNVYKELDRLAADGAVTKELNGYLRAPGLKIARK